MAAAWQAMQAGAPAPMGDPAAQLQMLKTQAEVLEAQLEQIREAIGQFEDDAPSEAP